MNYVKAWKEPDYPEGDWIDEQEWTDSGLEEFFEEVRAYDAESFEGLEGGYFAVYCENDTGCERVIPVEYSGNFFETVGGVLDSNPGFTQRYTQWSTAYTEEGLRKDVEAMDGKIVELSEDDVQLIEDFIDERPLNIDVAGAVSATFTGLSGLFR